VKSTTAARAIVKACIPPKGRPVVAGPALYRERWRVERAFAWPGDRRRLPVRRERRLTVHRGFFTFALMLIAINRLLN
jgi:hypothetical protein